MVHSKETVQMLLEEIRQIKDNQQKTHLALFGDDLSDPQKIGAIQKIISRQDKTNGKVKLAFWMASTAMGLIVTVLVTLAMGKV